MEQQKAAEKLSRGERSGLIRQFLRGSMGWFVLCMVCAALSALADMITPQIIRVAVDHVIGHSDPETLSPVIRGIVDRAGGAAYLKANLWVMAIAIIVVAAVKAGSQYGFRVSNARGSETLVKTMRDTLYNHIERLPFQWHMTHHTGDIIQRCTSDIETTRNFVSEQLTNLIRIGILLLLSLVFMLGMNIALTGIAMIPIPAIVWYSIRFHGKIHTAFEKCDENEGKLSAMAQENLTGVRVVRAFGRERYEKDRFEKQNEHYTGLWVKMGETLSLFWSVSDVLSGIQVMLIVVFGVVFCLRGQMTSGEYIAFISYNGMLVWPVRMLGRMISEMSKAGVSVDRIGQIMKAEEERDEVGAKTPPMDREIRFEHVSFGYEGAPEMLHDISLTIPAGSTLGILGGTGSGKSTLILLLGKLYPLEEGAGAIRIGGTDIRDIDTAWLRRNMAMVLQEPFLFSRSIRENIAMAEDGLSEEALRSAAGTACLDETIESFSAGYDIFVGERGVTLSGGQKQRLAIARALTRNAPVMVFDDSLSAVDTETDARIRTGLSERFRGATVILISHRITTLKNADQILVLDRGRVVERGTHEELRQAGGLYQQICSIQEAAE